MSCLCRHHITDSEGTRSIQLTLKRAFDIVVSLAVLTLLFPLMALIALALCNSEAVLHRAGHQAR